jgi:hypothetical protein
MRRNNIAILLLGLCLASCTTIKQSEFYCNVTNGVRIKTMFGHACPKKYSDAGKSCTSSEQCEGICFAGRGIKAERVTAVGYCQHHNYNANHPEFSVENGRAKLHISVEE